MKWRVWNCRRAAGIWECPIRRGWTIRSLSTAGVRISTIRVRLFIAYIADVGMIWQSYPLPWLCRFQGGYAEGYAFPQGMYAYGSPPFGGPPGVFGSPGGMPGGLYGPFPGFGAGGGGYPAPHSFGQGPGAASLYGSTGGGGGGPYNGTQIPIPSPSHLEAQGRVKNGM